MSSDSVVFSTQRLLQLRHDKPFGASHEREERPVRMLRYDLIPVRVNEFETAAA
jgi:hypothetical protein